MINERSNLLPAKARANSLSLSWNWVPKRVLIEAPTNAALTRFLQLCPASGYSRASGVETPRVWTKIATKRKRKIHASLAFEVRTNSFEYSALLDRIRRVEVHYASVKREGRPESKRDYEQTKVRSEASLAGKPQNSGLLVNIECLVSYPIGRNISEEKEVRAKLPLYRISQSR